jgi:hypothetical protein
LFLFPRCFSFLSVIMDNLFGDITSPSGKSPPMDKVARGTVGGYVTESVDAVGIEGEGGKEPQGKLAVASESDRNEQRLPSNVSFALSSSTSTGHGLFYLNSPLGEEICGHAFGSTGGTPRFCCQAVVAGTDACTVVKHAKTTKAVVAAGSWFVTVGIRGSAHRGALTLKSVAKTEIPESLWTNLNQDKHEPEDWERIFDHGRLSMRVGSSVGTSKPSAIVLHEMFTPKKTRPESDGSEKVWMEASPGLTPLATILGPKMILWNSEESDKAKFSLLHETIHKIQKNFDVVEGNQTSEAEDTREWVEDLRTKMNGLVLITSAFQSRLGTPDALMKELGVTNPFDGLRSVSDRLTTLSEELTKPFLKNPYAEVVSRLAKMEHSFRMLADSSNVSDRVDALSTVVTKLTSDTISNFGKTINEYLKPFNEFYKDCLLRGSSIFDRLTSIEDNMQRNSADAQTFGSIRFPSHDARPGREGKGRASESETIVMQKVLGRLAALESQNRQLEAESADLRDQVADQRWEGGRGSVRATARFSESTANCLTFDGNAMIERISALEGDRKGSEVVRQGGFTFTGVDDCEAFLRNHVPPDGFMGYDFVSLVHRSNAGSYTTIQETLAREYQVGKGGFVSMHTAYIYTSMRQSFPEPLAGVSSASDPVPIPKLKTFALWDQGEGTRGIRYDITAANQSTVEALTSRLDSFSPHHGDGRALFRSMIMDSQMQWKAFAIFLSEKYNSCEQQTGDSKESWLYPLEVGKGVYDELHKVRCIGAERTTVIKLDGKDEARLLWGALLCHKMMEEFIACSFVGHPKLAKYSIQHLFKNRVKQKDLSTINKDLDKVKNELKGLTTTQQKLVRKAGI